MAQLIWGLLMTLPKWNDQSFEPRHDDQDRFVADERSRCRQHLYEGTAPASVYGDITQADRRLRDLRDYGWVIQPSTRDLTLRPRSDGSSPRASPFGIVAFERMP